MVAIDDWPRTRRPLPWMIALFLVMLFLVPFDSIDLPISFPVDPTLDRFVLIALSLTWLCTALTGRSRPRFRHAPINVATYLFVSVCLLSVALNLRDLAWDGELSLSVKQLSLVVSYLTFFYVAASSIRSSEVANFARLAVLLAVLTALGTIYQYRSGSNLFITLAHDIFKGAKITLGNHQGHAGAAAGRLGASGPARHPLADATLLSAAVPLALVLCSHARRRRDALLMGAAVIVLLAGCVATGRKTALIVPVASLVVLVAYEPRRYLPYWPGLVVAAAIIVAAAPHAISSLIYQFGTGGSSSSTSARTSDYAAVAPFIKSHLLFGRGYGSFDPVKYRPLDDQMLGWLVQIGVVGTVAYTMVIAGAAMTAHRIARRACGLTDSLMAAVVAVSAGYFVSNFLYDSFGFRQGPYVFFFVAALGVAHAGTVSELRRWPADDVAPRDDDREPPVDVAPPDQGARIPVGAGTGQGT